MFETDISDHHKMVKIVILNALEKGESVFSL